MRLKDVRDLGDLRDIDTKEAIELADELGQLLSKRGWELWRRGKSEARRALGAPTGGALAIALMGGLAVGIGVGAGLAMLMTPMSGFDARRQLGQRVDRIRERAEELRIARDGRRAEHRDTVSETSEVI